MGQRYCGSTLGMRLLSTGLGSLVVLGPALSVVLFGICAPSAVMQNSGRVDDPPGTMPPTLMSISCRVMRTEVQRAFHIRMRSTQDRDLLSDT